MYDIRQFKPALYVLVLVGFTGFAIASNSPGVWMLSVGLLLLHVWLDRAGRFVPMPRLIANAVTLLCVVVAFMQIRVGGGTPILLIGNFLVLLQLVKYYELRANRDYAQLLILSLLLMVAASISTASLVFGMLLIGYLFLSLYCCLLFHLKVETDTAKAAIAPSSTSVVNPLTLRQDQRYLGSSMRRLTATVASVAIVMAVGVFLFFPRGAGQGLLGPLQFRPAQTLTGFSEQVSFQQVARITQNTEEVATVKVWHNDKLVKGGEPLLLRGMTLDVYTGKKGLPANPDDLRTRLPGEPFSWVRSSLVDDASVDTLANEFTRLSRADPADAWKQQVRLRPTGTSVLFAMPGPIAFSSTRDMPLLFSRRDGVLRMRDIPQVPIEYTVVSRNKLGPERPGLSDAVSDTIQRLRASAEGRNRRAEYDRGVGLPVESVDHTETAPDAIDDRVREYARRADVSGSDAQGPLAPRRPQDQRVSAFDADIASNIEHYLRNNFRYTLDLTDARNIGPGEDPIAWFLTDTVNGQRGHCEYFAGAMALMCQSLGMQARLVVGFKCDDYNSIGDYYSVRQNHAHAWVEVLTEGGWQTYDPTSGREDNKPINVSTWKKIKNLFNYFEYMWAANVVAYSGEDRSNLIQNVDAKLTNTAINSTGALMGLKRWFDSAKFWFISSTLLASFIGLMATGVFVAIGWFLWERWKVRRRAARIGLDSLPTDEQIRLVRQLGFYDDLLRLLEKHRITRPAHVTPLEFSDSLAYMPSEVYDTVRRLTNLFYRIRYGGAELQTPQRRRLINVIGRLESAMGPAPKGP